MCLRPHSQQVASLILAALAFSCMVYGDSQIFRFGLSLAFIFVDLQMCATVTKLLLLPFMKRALLFSMSMAIFNFTYPVLLEFLLRLLEHWICCLWLWHLFILLVWFILIKECLLHKGHKLLWPEHGALWNPRLDSLSLKLNSASYMVLAGCLKFLIFTTDPLCKTWSKSFAIFRLAEVHGRPIVCFNKALKNRLT